MINISVRYWNRARVLSSLLLLLLFPIFLISSTENTIQHIDFCKHIESSPSRINYNSVNSAKQATPPSAPRNLTAGISRILLYMRPAAVELMWDVPITNGGSNITSYRVYRGTTSGALSLLDVVDVSNENETGYTDLDIEDYITFYYAVSAVNAIGEGPRSMELEVVIEWNTGPPFPGFPWETVILGIVFALGLIILLRKRKPQM